jgi:hypothetical protein
MMTQLTLRLISSGTHPLHNLFVAKFAKAAEEYKAEQRAPGSAPPISG